MERHTVCFGKDSGPQTVKLVPSFSSKLVSFDPGHQTGWAPHVGVRHLAQKRHGNGAESVQSREITDAREILVQRMYDDVQWVSNKHLQLRTTRALVHVAPTTIIRAA